VIVIEKALFSDSAHGWLRRGLDVSELRRRISAENIANVDTPGYHAKRVRFEELLGDSIEALSSATPNPGHITPRAPAVLPEVIPADDPMLPNGVNNVDAERELGVVGWNTLQMSAMVEFASRRFQMLNEAITYGRR
jgi:flagellar basal-body rod protein FlgB